MRLTEDEYSALIAKRVASMSDIAKDLRLGVTCSGMKREAEAMVPLKFKPASIVGPKPAKYGNKKVTVDGIVFDSAKESRRWVTLSQLQNAGHISKLERQRVFVLAPSVTLDGRKKPELRYMSDFSYINSDGALVVEDTKSAPTKKLPAFRIKKHLMMHVFQQAITEV